jgi:hypothetical protein
MHVIGFEYAARQGNYANLRACFSGSLFMHRDTSKNFVSGRRRKVLRSKDLEYHMGKQRGCEFATMRAGDMLGSSEPTTGLLRAGAFARKMKFQ